MHPNNPNQANNFCMFATKLFVIAINMEKTITEIVELLDEGERVYMHRETLELWSFPDPERNEAVWETEYLMEEVLDEVEAHPEDFIEFRPLEKRADYNMMAEFAQELPDQRQASALLDALSSKKPFRHFREVLRHHDLEEDWYDFRKNALKALVLNELELKI